MKTSSARFSPSCASGIVLLLFTICAAFGAEPAASVAPLPAGTEELNSQEIQRSLLQVREQLRTTQLALASSQAAAEAKARADAAAISEQLESIKSSLLSERERHDLESRQWQAERERQDLETRQAAAEHERLQIENARSNQRLLYIASSFGGVGLMAMIFMPLFQWRAAQRTAEANAQRSSLPALLPADSRGAIEGEDPGVARSNQRLLSAIDRIEKRILELENTANSPAVIGELPVPGTARAGVATPRLSNVPTLPNPRISLLLAKGRSLLSTNKPNEALACYDEVLAIDPRHTEALLKKGMAFERLQRDAEAIASYDRVIAVDAKMALAYLHKGGVCQRLARHEDAIACYEQALLAEDRSK